MWLLTLGALALFIALERRPRQMVDVRYLPPVLARPWERTPAGWRVEWPLS